MIDTISVSLLGRSTICCNKNCFINDPASVEVAVDVSRIIHPIVFTLVGALAGIVFSRVRDKNTQIGAPANIVIGSMAAIIVGYLFKTMFIPNVSGVSVTNVLVALVGAVILLFIMPLVLSQSEGNIPKPDPVLQKPLPKKVAQGIIFLSYRRSDSQDIAGRIYDRLLPAFGKVSIFKDVDAIPLGADFKKFLDEQVSECNVLLAVIGDTWLEARDAAGNKRLEDPRDFVRLEIESALKRDIPVIPLLVRGASMPSEEQLPDSLKKLSFRNGTLIRPDPDFHRDMDRLISHLKNYVKPKP